MNIEEAQPLLGDEFTFFSEVILQHLPSLGLDPGARILDVGTGRGRVAITLAPQAVHLDCGRVASVRDVVARGETQAPTRVINVSQK